MLERIDRLLQLDQGPVMAYDDPQRAVGKRVRIEQGRITALRLAGETAAWSWLKSLWQEGRVDADLRRWLLAPLSAPPGTGACSANRTLCNCMDVGLQAVQAASPGAGPGRAEGSAGLRHALRLLRTGNQENAGGACADRGERLRRRP